MWVGGEKESTETCGDKYGKIYLSQQDVDFVLHRTASYMDNMVAVMVLKQINNKENDTATAFNSIPNC